MKLVTWNVLHRVHAVNWQEPVIASWPKESARLGSIADVINTFEADVVCLQEVSGDMLQMLRDVVEGEIFATAYPRVPAYRKAHVGDLRELAEYLVTITKSPARLVGAEAFPADGGKGFQRVELSSGETILCTHVSYGDKRPVQLARLAEEARAAPGLCVICGDFNADRQTCLAELGDDFVAGAWSPVMLPTRPRADDATKSQDIDHVFVREGGTPEIEVLDGEGRSDHNPVSAIVR